ncbi:uncharacterized protein LOC134277694 [Saccostrea cucullata]|uniref:uncharacterized protein LOC134277694 n=1 Tax=Saccostrea cuccullata TaxID=36930 RepID=UPI002ED522A1
MDHIPRLSEILYVGLSRFEIGTPSKVAIRRDVRDVEDLLHRKPKKRKNKCPVRLMLSGSHREGFRLNSSDMDYMSWVDCFKVINNLCQLRDYNPSIHHIMLMEDTDISPGFVRLQLLTPPRLNSLRFLIITLNDRFYISNLLWRQWIFHNFFSAHNLQNSYLHGPCTSGYEGTIQYDHTLCVFCKYWPSTTGNWIKRCLGHVWPPENVLKDILNDGCHCVPIGSKCTTSRNDLEWRLSFSMAELKLVYSMNHTQFICYGLLKIFLKEVINKNVEEPLLCSYFMKTTIFWLIQVGHMNWCPNNLLKCFWMCFKYLILCVYRGKFANFFIPQNNMFLNKIVGVARESLLEQLYQYYRLGVSSLLLSPTLRSILEPALYDLTIVIPLSEGHSNDIACNDLCFEK